MSCIRTWEEKCKQYIWYFPILPGCETGAFEIERIHPLKQEKILKIFHSVSRIPKVKIVYVIGSSVSMKCGIHSDIDLVVGLDPASQTTEDKNEISLIIQNASDWDCDIIWMDRISKKDRIYGELERGVVLKNEQTVE